MLSHITLDILATNEFLEPRYMFMKGIDNIKFGSKDFLKQDTCMMLCIYLCKDLWTSQNNDTTVVPPI